MGHPIEMLPVVEPRPFQVMSIDLEPQRLDQMESALGGKAESPDGPRILGDLGFDQDNIELRGHGFR